MSVCLFFFVESRGEGGGGGGERATLTIQDNSHYIKMQKFRILYRKTDTYLSSGDNAVMVFWYKCLQL